MAAAIVELILIALIMILTTLPRAVADAGFKSLEQDCSPPQSAPARWRPGSRK